MKIATKKRFATRSKMAWGNCLAIFTTNIKSNFDLATKSNFDLATVQMPRD